MLVDWLVFRGRTFARGHRSVADERWTQWQADRAAGAEWTRTIQNWTRNKKGDVRIVFEGPFSAPDEQGERQQISIYYFILKQYQPAMGPPAQQAYDGLIDRDELRLLADEKRRAGGTPDNPVQTKPGALPRPVGSPDGPLLRGSVRFESSRRCLAS
ncbi:MAG TPA: hypothetical protein VF241_13465 [Propionibacteriaceae bacterium]